MWVLVVSHAATSIRWIQASAFLSVLSNCKRDGAWSPWAWVQSTFDVTCLEHVVQVFFLYHVTHVICCTYIRTLLSSTAKRKKFLHMRINLMIDQPEKGKRSYKFVTLSYSMLYSFLVFSYVQSKIRIAWVVRIAWATSLTLRSWSFRIPIAVSGCRPNSTQFIHGMDAYRSILGSSVRASFSFSGSLDSRGPPLKTLSGEGLKPFKFRSISKNKNGSFPHLVIAAPRNSIMYETQFGTA